MNSGWAPVARNAVFIAVLFIVAVTPLVISQSGDDAFREPKLLFFQTVTLLIVAIGGFVLLHDAEVRRVAAAQTFAIGAAALALIWTVVVTLLSRKQAVSHDAPFTLFCYAAFFTAAMLSARRNVRLALGAVALPAVITAVYALAQLRGLPTPLIEHDPAGTRAQVIALLGNPNYVATFLVLPIIACVSLMFAWRRRRALLLLVLVVPMLAAVAATLTVTAVIALGIGLAAFGVTAPARRTRFTIAALLLIGLVGLAAFGPARERAAQLTRLFREGRYDILTSHRTPAFRAATLMIAERPLLGVGPGVFAADYMRYRMKVDELHPDWIHPANTNFGEVHNDHLQLLAEGGIPAYLLFLAFCGRIAWMSFRRDEHDDAAARFVRVFAFPAVTAFAVLALAQFPMQLAASASTALYLAALCFAWERPAA